MAKTAWPTSTELTTALTGLGLTLPSGFAAADIAAGVVSDWHRMTNTNPWLAATPASARLFDSPTDSILFTHPYVSAPSSVLFDSTELDSDTYFAYPTENASNGMPYTGIIFQGIVTGPPSGITVEAEWGVQENIDLHIWNAALNLMVARAASIINSGSFSGVSGPIEEIRQDQVTYKFGATGSSSLSRSTDAEDVFKKLARDNRY